MADYQDFLYSPIEAYETGFMDVSGGHSLYWEQSGNPNGAPVIVLHGGPGAGLDDDLRRYFDPDHYRIVMFDQRGAKRSKPLGGLENNTPALLIQDIETLRVNLGIEEWLIFGGSWGSALALYYAEHFPDLCVGLILRGIYFHTPEEHEWWFQKMGHVFPEVFDKFSKLVPAEKSDNLLLAYYEMLTGDNEEVRRQAALCWNQYAMVCSKFTYPRFSEEDFYQDEEALTAFAILHTHYCVNNRFEPEDYILKHIENVKGIRGVIVQGRYDIICPMKSSYELHQAWPEAEYIVVPEGGHSAYDAEICKALVKATDQFKN